MNPSDLPIAVVDAAERAYAAERWASPRVRLMYAINAAIHAMPPDSELERLHSVAHRLALDLECLLLSTDNPTATKWWSEANSTLESWRAMLSEAPKEPKS